MNNLRVRLNAALLADGYCLTEQELDRVESIVTPDAPKPDVVRVLRLVEFVGPRAKVEAQLARSLGDGRRHVGPRNVSSINIATLPAETLEGQQNVPAPWHMMDDDVWKIIRELAAMGFISGDDLGRVTTDQVAAIAREVSK